MKLPRRKFLHLAAGAAALPAVSRIAREFAQKGFDTIMSNAKKYDAKANLLGVQVQQIVDDAGMTVMAKEAAATAEHRITWSREPKIWSGIPRTMASRRA